MHAGTSLVGSTTRSVMAKRVGSAGVTAECGICYSSMPARTETRPFQCNHSICTTCDRRMQGVDDNRCPTCRRPRQGMSAAEAEPPPDRNFSMPSVEDTLPPDVWQDLIDFGEQAAQYAAQTLRAGGYGLPPGARNRRQNARAAPYQRPNTGYVMRFPVNPPGEWGEREQEVASEMQEDQRDGFVAGGLPGGLPLRVTMADAHTLQAIGALPTDVISALLNVPDVSLHQWHVIRTGQRRVTAAPRRPPRAPSSSRSGPVRARRR